MAAALGALLVGVAATVLLLAVGAVLADLPWSARWLDLVLGCRHGGVCDVCARRHYLETLARVEADADPSDDGGAA